MLIDRLLTLSRDLRSKLFTCPLRHPWEYGQGSAWFQYKIISMDRDLAKSIIYVLDSGPGCFPAGIFRSRGEAESVIREKGLSGLLTEYPVDVLVYDHNLEGGHIRLTKAWQTTAKYIQQHASPGGCDHWHYTDGDGPDDPDDGQQSDIQTDEVFVFTGRFSNLSCGFFTARELAEERIGHYGLTGILAAYPLGKCFLQYRLAPHPQYPEIIYWDDDQVRVQLSRTDLPLKRWCYRDGIAADSIFDS